MGKLKSFLKTSLLGGVVVILPVAILAAVSLWVFNLVTGLIEPLTRLLIKDSQLNEYAAEVIVIILIVVSCFFVGVLVRTRLGSFFYRVIETRILQLAPGYSMIKDTVLQIFGSRKDSPFSSVAIAQIFGNDTRVTAFITDKHADGSYTLFVPTGPNPTSGLIYHLDGKYVQPVKIPVQDAMRSIISCGAGSAKLMQDYTAQRAGG
ncbi:MAG TPA: DUF502 domain-containing protein [Gammaproteobacteria bacterium]|nr:DUF502 domain-containing protein [Gammaproteobacteria bacterium]